MTFNAGRKNKYGFCKYRGDKCHFRHEKQICTDNNCNIFACERRHPRKCSWYFEYGRCKFTTYCKFKHESSDNKQVIVNKVRDNENKLTEIQKQIDIYEFEENEIKKRLDTYEVEVQRRIETCMEKLNVVVKLLEEKDVKFVKLENDFKEMKESFDKTLKERILEDTNSNSKLFKCNLCEFSSTSEKGLKTHKSRMHTTSHNGVETSSSYPKECEICEKSIRNEREMKTHLKTHSYIRPVFKCEKCEFCSENVFTMEVHQGKNHDKNFECGLCGFFAKSEEDLDLHLFTCEIYSCDDCGTRLNTISELKKHLSDDKHRIRNNQYYKIIHAKIGKNSDSEINLKTYFKEDFISKN